MNIIKCVWLLKKKIVTPVLAACRNQNFGRRITHHAACRIERNGTVTHFPEHFSSHVPNPNNITQMPLPLASQSHIPSLRQTPLSSHEIRHIHHTSASRSSEHRNNTNSRASQRIHSSPPIAYYQPQPEPAFLPPRTVPLPCLASPLTHNPLPRPHVTHTNPTRSISDISFSTHSLPSTKDVDAQGLCLASLSLLFLFFYLKNACASTG